MCVRHAILLGLTFWLWPGRVPASSGAWDAIPVSDAWHFRVWQTDEGLPDNMVTGVAQAPDGFLWVATFGGLLRFDGAEFEEFPLFHLPDIPNRVVNHMEIDPDGRLWLAMDRGAVVCAYRESAQVYTGRDGLLGSRIRAIEADDAGGLWVVYGADLLRLDKGRVERPHQALASLPNRFPWAVTSDVQGRTWIARGGEIGVLQEGTWQFRVAVNPLPVHLAPMRPSGLWICAGNSVLRYREGQPPVEVAQLPPDVEVQTLLEDRMGALWIGTNARGLLRWSDGVLEWIPTSNSQIVCLAEDDEGSIWVGTAGGGLNRVRQRSVEMITVASGLPSESIRCISEDPDGVLWAVTDNSLLVHNKPGQWTVAGPEEGWPGLRASCVTVDREGAVWVGTTRSSVVRLYRGTRGEWGPGQGFGGNARAMLASSRGDVWVATGRPLRLFRLRDGVLDEVTLGQELQNVRALAETVEGRIWAGTAEGQLVEMDPEGLVGTIQLASPDLSIRSLLATPDGSLWIGYAGSGICRMKGGEYSSITEGQGLQDNYVSQMQLDERGDMWITSNHGLFRVPLQQMVAVAEGESVAVHATRYGRSEGLPTFQPAYNWFPSACRGRNGQLWFATRNGLLHVTPARIQDHTNDTPVLLKRVSVDESVVALWDSHSALRPRSASNAVDLRAPEASLLLAPAHRKIEFEFAALTYASLDNVGIRYRLSDFDGEWINGGSQRSATYSRLPAGRYEFQVQARNLGGVWETTGFRLPLQVTPFFWQTWWFRTTSTLLFTAGIVGVVRFVSFRRLKRKLEHLEREEALHHERARIARDMHDEVGSKLSRLSLLSEMASQDAEMPPAPRQEVAEISETARETIRSLEEIVWAVNPKNDMLANLMHYLCRFAEDFFEGSGIVCVFDIPSEIPEIELPTDLRHHVFLAAKEAINNVYKHAAAHRVSVHLRGIPAGFEIEIEDDGRGFSESARSAAARSGNGLENMRERMRQAGGECEILSQPGSGTRVILRGRVPRAARR